MTASRLNCRSARGLWSCARPTGERVTCPNCGSLLDINHGDSRYLTTLTPKGNQPSVPLGSIAEFEGQQ